MITLDKLKQQFVEKKSEIESLKRYEKEIESKIQAIKNEDVKITTFKYSPY